jgi:hypothetical protein
LRKDEAEWSDSSACHFIPKEKTPGAHFIGNREGLRAGLDFMKREKFLASTGN